MNTSLANMWRTGPDIGASYEQVLDRAMIANTVDAYLRGGPGGWNDPDMLQAGNIGRKANGGSPPSLYPEAEGRTQFALWCILKSPLLIGSFLHNMTDATFATLTNKVAIGVNQDVLGEQAVLRKDGGWVPDKPRPTTNVAYGYQIWSGALANGGAAVVLANLDGNASQAITLTNNEMPSSRRGNAKWDITEAFTGTVMPGVVLPKETTVGRHDIAMWVLRPAV
jgi:alpha-galactosidase